ncbi:molybdopterin-dependent oxidoreductase [Magnetospirillum sp. 15-1]|uniref:molybdopterin-containing oxidoreductase family protein n=1 Tax=Magnetospirillum sp. 15-1 TaxID=1979370 RepID=UPI000BBBC052|nr:molybdopterin-dependent oxidoreductase [Magnetospirillum sp. 15-1]
MDHTVCHCCYANCGLSVLVEEGRVVKITGDKGNPAYRGFLCSKGGEAGGHYSSPNRLLHSQKRQEDGSFAPIRSAAAIREIGDKVAALLDRHGPRSIAIYLGSHGFINTPVFGLHGAFASALGTPMLFTSVTIDMPGKSVASSLHGIWLAGAPSLSELDTVCLVGNNPLISMTGGGGNNPIAGFRELRERGAKVIVIDPRRSESAAKADVHLQINPGEDAAVLAGFVRYLITENLYDSEFVDAETIGFETLRSAVAPFTPEMVASRAGISVEEYIIAARQFGAARRLGINCATGPSMSGQGNIVEYLARVLQTLRGSWRRAGDRIANPGVFIRRPPPIAGSTGPLPAYGFGEKLRVRNLGNSAAGMPTAGLAEEILTPGEGQVKALFVFGGNPVSCWPDQAMAHKAMKELELLVVVDPQMTTTARLADYVVAPKMPMEMPSVSYFSEFFSHIDIGTGWGYQQPYAQYAPAILAPPSDSDLIEDWELMTGILGRIGRPCTIPSMAYLHPTEAMANGTVLGPGANPSSEEILAALFKDAPVSLSEIKEKGREGHVFDLPEMVAVPKPGDWPGKLDIGNLVMLEALDMAALPPAGRDNPDFPYRMISRRTRGVFNSCWHSELSRLRHNPAFMNPADMKKEGLRPGDRIDVRSEAGSVLCIVEGDEGVKAGCVSISHGFGGIPDDGAAPFQGSNINLLTRVDADFDVYTGMPRLSNVPISVTRA